METETEVGFDDTALKERPIEKLFHSAAARIVDFFILNDEYDYSESEIAKRTGLSVKTVSREMPTLRAEGIVKSRKHGRSDMYKLNRDARKVRGLQLYVKDALDIRFEEFAGTNDVSISPKSEKEQTTLQ
jgi:DNA-binding IscR family transcriptional regulator